MEFRLNEYHRNIRDEELISDLVSVANKLDAKSLTTEQYNKNGKYNSSTFIRRFEYWNNALNLAGLLPSHKNNFNPNNYNVTDNVIIEDLKNVAKMLNKKTVTSSEYDKLGKHGKDYVIRRFDTWENALKIANLEPTGFHHKVSKEELLKEIEIIWIKLGRQPTSTDIKKGISKYSLNSFSRHFGSWRKALEIFVDYINCDDNDAEDQTEDNIYENAKEKSIHKNTSKQNDTHKTKRDINLRLRFKVMQRDNFKCCICGSSPATDPTVILHVDHIKPWSKGGETTLDNLQTLCSDCNLGKSDLDM